MRLKLFISWLLLALVACESHTSFPKIDSSGYYPIQKGSQWTYAVVETQFSPVTGQTTASYDLKVIVSDTLVASSGEVIYTLQRFRRVDDTQPYTATDTWSVRKSDFTVVVQQGNIPYLKLSLPLSAGKTWNGNAYNNLGGKDRCTDGTVNCDAYAVKALAQGFQLGTLSYKNTVTIEENSAQDPIVGQDVRTSVYAFGVGLVYYESNVFSYCTVGTCIGKQIVESGVAYKQTLKDYVAR
ncbi:MAG TPA: hypothetical protein PLX35_14555 [Cyclobacteriaceae bacterium]|nr:hypothetical protein [Cyclobacteriaceae bacterium]HQQ98488.1 hypothetical protein [Cyclobacteriaceae bacterium]